MSESQEELLAFSPPGNTSEDQLPKRRAANVLMAVDGHLDGLLQRFQGPLRGGVPAIGQTPNAGERTYVDLQLALQVFAQHFGKIREQSNALVDALSEMERERDSLALRVTNLEAMLQRKSLPKVR